MTTKTEPVTFDLLCPSCGGAVTLHIDGWGTRSITDTPWVCPYCKGPHHFATSGRLVRVAKSEASQRTH